MLCAMGGFVAGLRNRQTASADTRSNGQVRAGNLPVLWGQALCYNEGTEASLDQVSYTS
jgi:hypothetical protein